MPLNSETCCNVTHYPLTTDSLQQLHYNFRPESFRIKAPDEPHIFLYTVYDMNKQTKLVHIIALSDVLLYAHVAM